MTAPLAFSPTRPEVATTSRLLVAIVLLGAAASRFVALELDPPQWMPEATVMDEGLWADGARGKLLFGDWFADDTGNAFLAVPFYSALLVGSYTVFGVDLWATRFVPAFASLLLIVVAWRLGRRYLGPSDGVRLAALLTISPFLWAHSRFGVVEVAQTLCIATSFALLFCRARTAWWAAMLAGAAMAAAVTVKPNALVYGVGPLIVAWLLRWWFQARNGESSPHRRHLLGGAAVVAGGVLALLPFVLIVWNPNWDAVQQTLKHEGGIGQATLGASMLRLGYWGSREGYPGTHALWGPARSAPVLTLIGWLYALWTFLRLAHRGSPIHRRLAGWEWPVLAWALVTFCAAEFSFQSATRRMVHLMVPLALLGYAWWSARRHHPAEMLGLVEPDRRSVGFRLAGWLVLSWPALIVVKPALANGLRPQVAGLFESDPRGGATAGLLVLACWLLLVVGAAVMRWDPQRWILRFTMRLGPALLPLLIAAELVLVVSHMATGPSSIRAAQKRVEALVEPGEIVFGAHAAVLAQTSGARTVRRVLPGQMYSGPRPNPDAGDRLRPRYIIDYVDPAKAEYGDLTGSGAFRAKTVISYIIEPGGYPRFVLQLWERID